MSIVSSPDVIHISEPYAQVVYGGVDVGNVDSRFGSPESVAANRSRLLSHMNPARYVLQIVQLGSEFVDLSGATDDDLEETYPTDGLFINRPGVALGLNPADCNAITMYDGREGRALGLIHAGRQGVDGDIHLAALENLVTGHKVAKEDVRMHFAPSIRQASYYYPTIAAEQLADPRWQPFIDLRKSNYHLDLVGRIVKEFTDAGIDPAQMEISPIDTGADSRYFSWVRSKREGVPLGRNSVAAMLGYSATA